MSPVKISRCRIALPAVLLLALIGGASVRAAAQDAANPTTSADPVKAVDPVKPADSVQSTVAPPDAREVVAHGRAAIGPGGLASARQAAIAAALREAVEKTTGVFVSARTLTHNYQLVHDQVVTHGEGFATLESVLREEDKPQAVFVIVRALVSLRPLAQELKELNLTRAWRVRVATATEESGGSAVSKSDQAVVDALEKALLDAGFVVVSTDDDADIAVRVTPDFTNIVDASLHTRVGSLTMRAVRGDISIRATRAQTGEVVAVCSASNTAVQLDDASAQSDAVGKAVQAIAPHLTDALMLLPARDSQPVQLVVNGIGTAARATHLEANLNNLAGVRSVTRRSYVAGDAVWEIDVLSDVEPDLARELEESSAFKPFKLSVTSDTLAKIVASAPFSKHKPAAAKVAGAKVKVLVDPPTAPAQPIVVVDPPAVPAAPIVVTVPDAPKAEPVPVPEVKTPDIAADTPVPAEAVTVPEPAQTASNGQIPADHRVNPKDGAEMVWIPAGSFVMGDDDIRNNPRHRVTLGGYYIYKDVVTVAMYRQFCTSTSRKMPFPPSGGWLDDRPIVNVSYEDACEYCTWAGVRLPTEAEWEKAARGTEGRRYLRGDGFEPGWALASRLAHDHSGGGTPAFSARLNAQSPYGVLDMTGSVLQWCADWYDPNFVRFSRAENPTGPERARDKVLRGCSWNDHSLADFRTARRAHVPPTAEMNNVGFRAVAVQQRWAQAGE